MNPKLALLRDEVEVALGGLNECQTQLRPAADSERWSIQQIVRHLTLTYSATIEAMDARIAKGSPTHAKPTLVQSVAQFALIRIGYFPSGRSAPERVWPPCEDTFPSGVLIAQVNESLREMDRRIAAAEMIFGPTRRTVNHMILGPLNLDQWRGFHLVHGRHHIKQIRAIRDEYDV